LHYQPISILQSGQIIGFEALIRWMHPQKGLLPPVDFIPLAEESGLIIPIGTWVLQEACAQLKAWHKLYPDKQEIKMNVNISGKQFSQPNLVETVQEVLRINDLKPANLKLEITETVLIENFTAANEIFSRLSALGVQLEIDDFGTGYSSLGYLQHFPIRTIKIDRSFINQMGPNGKGSEIIRAMISMARDLGMESIAEGVETAEQKEELQVLNCEYAQGFLISQPMEAKIAGAYLAQSN
jgi:EAL domain-containing protein (putative c-di-GMP-specific phosphodiesterase class I)